MLLAVPLLAVLRCVGTRLSQNARRDIVRLWVYKIKEELLRRHDADEDFLLEPEAFKLASRRVSMEYEPGPLSGKLETDASLQRLVRLAMLADDSIAVSAVLLKGKPVDCLQWQGPHTAPAVPNSALKRMRRR